MPIPAPLRRLTPNALKNSESARALALGAGLIPPRPMHTDGEADLLARLAPGRATVAEIGTYEGSSAVVLAAAMDTDATLHLIDSYEGNALLFGWKGSERATRRLMERETRRRGGPAIEWHIRRSADAARDWSGPIDLLFIDGDHTEEGCLADWEAFSPHVAPGGVVVFHDARAGRPGGGYAWPGPTAVVDGLFRGPEGRGGWEITDEVDSAVAVTRRGAAQCSERRPRGAVPKA